LGISDFAAVSGRLVPLIGGSSGVANQIAVHCET